MKRLYQLIFTYLTELMLLVVVLESQVLVVVTGQRSSEYS